MVWGRIYRKKGGPPVEKEESIGTWTLIILNLLVYGFIALHGKPTDPTVMLKYGAKWAPEIYAGQWWRFLTAPFLHFGLIHLGMNLYALFAVGPQVEHLFGWFKFVLIYLFAALWGVLGSLYFSPQSLSAGASGAIFGLVGALLCFALLYRQYMRPGALVNLLVVIGANLALGLIIRGIDNFAHLGGLVAGFCVAFLLSFKGKKRILAVTLFGVLTLFLIKGAAFPPAGSWRQLSAAGSRALASEDYPLAVGQLEEARGKAPASMAGYFEPQLAQAHFYLGNEFLEQGKSQAAEHYLKSLAYQQDPATYHNLVLAYLSFENEKKARETLTQALELYPQEDNLLKLKREFERRS